MQEAGKKRKCWTYLLPSPHGAERVEEAHVLEEIRVQPQPGGRGENRHDEEDQADDGHGEEQANETQHAHAEVPDALPEHEGPQREQDNGDDEHEGAGGVELLLPLRALVQPDVVVVVVGFLVLFDLDGPQALDALGLGVVVALVRVFVDLVDAEGKQGQREEFEGVLGGCAVRDFGEEGVLGACFLVGGGLEGTDCSLDCGVVSNGFTASCFPKTGVYL